MRPHRRPAWLPVRKRHVLLGMVQWLVADLVRWIDAENPRIVFQPYDWTLACRVR